MKIFKEIEKHYKLAKKLGKERKKRELEIVKFWFGELPIPNEGEK